MLEKRLHKGISKLINTPPNDPLLQDPTVFTELISVKGEGGDIWFAHLLTSFSRIPCCWLPELHEGVKGEGGDMRFAPHVVPLIQDPMMLTDLSSMRE